MPMLILRAFVSNSLASYFLVGGFGGLGKALAVWLVECRAKHLVFLSRGGMAESKFSAELGAMGCSVITVKGSVNNLEDVEDAIKKAPCPIRGVFHFFMVQMVSCQCRQYSNRLTSIGLSSSGYDVERLEGC